MRNYISGLVVISSLCLLPIAAQAAEFSLAVDSDLVTEGDELTVEVMVNTDVLVNALQGEILVSADQFAINKIYTGSSVVSFWVDHPKERSTGIVSFSGITPGGFTGINKTVLQLQLTALRPGTSTISFANMRLLAHDGLGSDVAFIKRPIVFTVAPKVVETPDRSVLTDTDAPEAFTPIIISTPDLFDGKKILIFTTQDKQSGVDAYYVREYTSRVGRFFSPWRKVESPYLLKDQSQQSFIDIKVVDIAGNERIVSVVPESAARATSGLLLVFLSAICLVTVLVLYRTKMRLQRLKQQKVHTSQK